MINIRTISTSIQFNDYINFNEEPELAIYKIIFRSIKNLVCIQKRTECEICAYKNTCIYNYLSGSNFRNINSVPVILKRSLISDLKFIKGDCIDFDLVFLGKANKFLDFFAFVLNELEVKGLLNTNVNIKHEVYKNDFSSKSIKRFIINTPMDYNEDVIQKEIRKLEELNKQHELFNSDLNFNSFNYKAELFELSYKKKVHIGSSIIEYKGFVGKVKFEEENNSLFSQLIQVIGMGNLYALGGGNIKNLN